MSDSVDKTHTFLHDVTLLHKLVLDMSVQQLVEILEWVNDRDLSVRLCELLQNPHTTYDNII